jgi:hypothetical protein
MFALQLLPGARNALAEYATHLTCSSDFHLRARRTLNVALV